MDKLKYIRLEDPEGGYSEPIPLSVDGEYVDVNGNNLTNELSNKASISYVDEEDNILAESINVQKVRIDNLAQLNPGSTTGDAELIDARIGAYGESYNNAGDAIREQIKNTGNLKINNQEYLYAIVDKDNKLLASIDTEGLVNWKKGIPQPILERLYSEENNNETEYVYAIVDKDNRLLASIKKDGSVDWEKGIPKPISEKLYSDEINNNEFLYTIVDKNNKLLASIRTDGSVDFKKFYWSKTNLNDLIEKIEETGFSMKSPLDWSDASELSIPIPNCAIVNITGINVWPVSKFIEQNAYLEFWDCQGNYFKKKIIFAAQGQSSLAFVKKNGSIDLCNDDWIGDDTFKIKFGEWVSQDSFHLKAYYTDYFRGVSVVSYQLMDEIVRTRGIFSDRPWKKELINEDEITSSANAFGGIDKNKLKLDTGARNFPDGFPCICYLNGEFYGIYSWQLKKHRDNFHMTKDDSAHVWLDGRIDANTLLNNNIDWSGIFEVRNPKNLWLMDGTEYDADFNAGELIDETSQYYNLDSDSSKIKKQKRITAQVKQYIIDLSNVMVEIKEKLNIYQSYPTDENLNLLKQTYETYFDVENQIDYLVFSDVVKNSDGFSKNWQWATYDGIKWYICPYDLDMTFGGYFEGDRITAPLTDHINNNPDLPSYYIINFYNTELENRYRELRDKKIIDKEHIIGLLNTWTKRIGVDNFDKEYEKWPDSPCFGESVINNGWEIVEGEMGVSSTYRSSVTYEAGDRCTYGLNSFSGFFTFEATETISNVPPVKTWKYNDSIWRVKKWLDEEINNMDTVYHYN